jgi:hypothetical protein
MVLRLELTDGEEKEGRGKSQLEQFMREES